MRGFLTFLALGLLNATAAPDELWLAAVEGRKIGSVDPALKSYYSEASRGALGLPGLRLIDTEKEPLEPGQSSIARFKGSYTMDVRCLERQKTKYLLELTLADKEGPILQSKVEIARGSPIIMAGPLSGDARLLFFVVIR